MHALNDNGYTTVLLYTACSYLPAFPTMHTRTALDLQQQYGDRCFTAAGPRLWNSLPADLRQADISFEQFRRLLKTFLFECWDRGALWLTVNLRLIRSLTYLLTYLLTYWSENLLVLWALRVTSELVKKWGSSAVCGLKLTMWVVSWPLYPRRRGCAAPVPV